MTRLRFTTASTTARTRRSGAAVWSRPALSLASALALVLALALVAALVPVVTSPTPAVAAAGDPPVLSAPSLVHSTGAELSWTRMTPGAGSTFTRYEVYRSTTAGVSASSTLLARFGKAGRTEKVDTTGKPSTTYFYRVAAVTTAASTPTTVWSNEVSAATPALGTATLTLQESSPRERATVLRSWDLGGTCATGENNGASTTDLTVGVTATATAKSTSRALLKFDLRRIPPGATISRADLTLTYAATPASAVTGAVTARALTRPWAAGTGVASCNAPGASWSSPEGGLDWSVPGGDSTATDAVTTATSPRASAGSDTFDLKAMVTAWTNGTRPNNGVLLKMTDETYPAAGSQRSAVYYPDDTSSPANRPSLTVTFTDGSGLVAPAVNLATPAAGAVVSGTVALTAAATDDGKVTSVEYLLDGASVGTASSAAGSPWTVQLNTVTAGVAAGSHTLKARATDDVGNVTLSDPVSVTVDNSPAVTGSVTAPTASSTVGGTVTLAATTSNTSRTKEVAFYVDDVQVGAPDTTSPYNASWVSYDQLAGLWNGSHALTVRVTDTAGRVTTSSPVTVTVANNTGTRYFATIVVQTGSDPATGAPRDPVNPNEPFPPVMVTGSTSSGGTVQDPYGGTSGGDTSGGSGGSTGKNLNSAPSSSSTSSLLSAASPLAVQAAPPPSPTPTGDDPSLPPAPKPTSTATPTPTPTSTSTPTACPVDYFCPTVDITNTSAKSWSKGTDFEIWYRWYAPNGAVMFEGAATDFFPNNFQKNSAKSFPLQIAPPPLPPLAESADLRLRIDLYDRDTGSTTPVPKWFSQYGNKPIDVPIRVVRSAQSAAKDLNVKLGFEKYWTYETEATGAGSTTATNIANGNMLWTWTPMALPGRGLSTNVDLTYNALEDHSHSVVGENFSLGVSTLTRLGEQVDVHPNKADRISGRSNKWISFADGDGTVHRFIGNADGSWTAPPGVNLFLRKVGSTEADARYWAISRPDFVTFYYTYDGYPSAVVDRNNNTITYTLGDVPAGEDPGGPKKRVTSLTEPGGRMLKFTYYSKASAPTPRVRGELAAVANLSLPGSSTPGSTALRFDYYDDGNLRRITQVGGVGSDGRATADRTFTFTYTTSSGDAPALAAAARANPDPHTPNQSVRLATITDPRGNETKYTYQGSGAGQQRWWLASRTNRAGETTTFTYSATGRITTATDPGGHASIFNYDTDGKLTSQTNAKNETIAYTWNSDFHPTGITEASGTTSAATTTMTWNANGYLTSQTVPTKAGDPGRTTRLCYSNVAVDGTDFAAHGSLLTAVIQPRSDVATQTDPCAALTPTSTFTYRFAYTNKNVTKATDPEGNATTYVWNVDPSADRGTLASATDPRGGITTFLAYHPSGQPTSVRDAENGLTGYGYNNDGDLTFVQTPLHQGATGSNDAEYRSKTYYDPFHRPTRTSQPKSFTDEPGTLVWTGTDYDPNDNVTSSRNPAYGATFPVTAPHADATYDAMDRPLTTVGPDRHLTPNEKTTFCYDSHGRLAKVLSPRSTATCASTLATGLDKATVYDYDVLDRVVGTTRAGAAGTTRSSYVCYDNVGNITGTIAPNAGLTAPPACPLTPGDYKTTASYFLDHQLDTVTDPKGRTSSFTYDGNGLTRTVKRQLTEGTTPRFTTETLSYDQRGLLIQRVVPFETGHDLTYQTQYDPNGNVTKDISPRGYDAATDKTNITDFFTGYRYDKLNRLTRVALPTGAGTPAAYEHYKYDEDSRLVRKSLPVADAEVADTAWSNIPGSSRTDLDLFDTGWIAASDDHVNPQVVFDYAAEGWQTRRTPRQTLDNTSPLASQLELNWAYFNDGTLRSRTDEDGHIAVYDYDANNNLTDATSDIGVTSDTDRAIRTKSTYNGFDELTRTEETKLLDDQAAWTTAFTTFGYDQDGNLVSRGEEGKLNAAGATVDAVKRNTYVYDTDDRLLRALAQGRDPSCAGDRRVTYGWNAAAWLTTRTVAKSTGGCADDTAANAYPGWDTSQTETRSYFDTGDLATQSLSNGAGTVLSTHALSYDQKSADATLPSAYTGQRTRDRWAAGTSGQCQVATGGQPGCANTWKFDARGKLLDYAQSTLDTGATLAHVAYSLDEATAGRQADTDLRAGNVTTERDLVRSITTTRSYTGNQLTTTSTGSADTKTWYDPLGRVDCVTTTAGTAAACSPRPSQAPGASVLVDYDYDYLDRLLAIRRFSGGTLTDKTTYVTDALDRVVSQNEMHTTTGGGSLTRTTAFTYSGASRQVASEKQTANGTVAGSPGQSTNGSTPACAAQSSGDTATYSASVDTKSYSYDPLGWRYRLADDLTCTTSGGTSYDRSTSVTFGLDPHGSVELATRDQNETTTSSVNNVPASTDVAGAGQGTVRAKYAYGPYGDLDKASSQGDTDQLTVFNPWRYTGKRYDTGSGTLDMGARRYDPGTARFLQQDIFKGALADLGLTLDPLSQNRYALAGGNPTSNIELDGHMAVSPTDTGGGHVRQYTRPDSGSSGDDSNSGGDGGGHWWNRAWDHTKDSASQSWNWSRDHADEIGTGVAIGVGVAAGAAICAGTAGFGCLVIGGAIAGATGAAAGYGTRVALSRSETFSAGELGKETAIGGIAGAATGGLAKGAGSLLARAFNRNAVPTLEEAVDAARASGRQRGAAAELRVGGRRFVGLSSGGEERTLHSAVQDAVDAVPDAVSARVPWHGECAELSCLSQALESGVDPQGGRMRAVAIGQSNPGHGLPKVICESCLSVMEKFGVSGG